MVPWPIALLTLLFGVMATLSLAGVVRIVTGLTTKPLIWPALWMVVSAGAAAGLPFLKPWARTLAVTGLVAMAAVALSVAGVLVLQGRPAAALLSTSGSVVYVIALRYLGRPHVRAWFH
jgi:hypothetical protein